MAGLVPVISLRDAKCACKRDARVKPALDIGKIMLGKTTLRPVTAAAVKTMLGDGQELALIDVREELTFSQNHLLWARNAPLSRLELRFARLVPRKTTRIVLCDDNDGLAQHAANILARAAYSDISYLDGGVAAWENAGYVTFSGVHVPSKAFGEFVEHDCGTPSISAQELDALMRTGTKMVVLDSRPFDEYSRISIPTGINVPGAELVLRIHDIAASPDITIVVNCAGRTRSIIGAQSLINAGVPNKVVALRNGTMGWHLAGLTCASGKAERAPAVSQAGFAWAKPAAEAVARRWKIERIDRATLDNWLGDERRTTYLFDVRDPDEYRAGHLPGAISAPGGQLVQATDLYAGVLGARIVCCDDREVRALMTASWLRQMGWRDVFVLPEAAQKSEQEKGEPTPLLLGTPATDRAVQPSAALEIDDVSVIDLSTSPHYRRGHIPGAWFAIRSRLEHALKKIAPTGDLILTSEDGVLASLAINEAQALTERPVHWLKGGNAAWAAAGFPLSTADKMADDPVDVWLKPYERADDNEAAMNAYLSWEVDLLERIQQDGTTHFLPAR
jgi:rhodanese-related sulfurtransferase